VFSTGTEVRIDIRYKHSRVKQYLKGGRALRIETVINKPADVGVLARREHLPELIAKARAVNLRGSRFEEDDLLGSDTPATDMEKRLCPGLVVGS
jgi:hypothetical protein